MNPNVPAAPARYAVVGHPVAHSQSPFIHAAFAAQTGQSIEYGRIDCGPDGFEAAVTAFAAAGAGGCNVTVPFKFDAARLARQLTPRARLAQAVNVLTFAAEGWLGDNSDGVGLVRDIERNAVRPLAGRRLLLVGAGGAAAGVLGPLLQARPAAVVVVNRSPHRAVELIARHADMAASLGVALTVAAIEDPGAAFDIVINATASSLQQAEVPVPARVLGPEALAVDLMYGRAAQGFVDWAGRHGAVGRDGLGMLVEQAAESFRIWRGIRPLTAPVIEQLRGDA